MPQQRSNKVQTPINSDAFNLIPDLATLADTIGSIVVVANQAEGDTVASARAAAGWPVSDSRPLYVYNLTTRTLQIKATAGWSELSPAIKHAEFTSAAVTQSANAGIIFGQYTADSARTFNNTFCSATAATNGMINILETGLYAITSWPQPPSSLGSNVHIFGTNSTEGTIMSSNFNSYGNAQTIVTVFVYLVSGTTCQFGVTGSNTVSGIVSRLKVTKVAG